MHIYTILRLKTRKSIVKYLVLLELSWKTYSECKPLQKGNQLRKQFPQSLRRISVDSQDFFTINELCF